MVNVNMMVILKMINHMVKDKHNMQTEIFIMVNSKRARRMVKENSFIVKQRTCMKESLRRDQRTGKGTMIYAKGDRYEGQWLDD